MPFIGFPLWLAPDRVHAIAQQRRSVDQLR
jgi:hypothetical protein